MPGASADTRRVKVINGNWDVGDAGQTGTFSLMIVTEDDERYTVTTTPEATAAVMSMARSGTVLLWDPEPQTLIVTNIVGDWLPQDWTSL